MSKDKMQKSETTSRLAGAFAPSAQPAPDMTIALAAGWLLNGAVLTEIASQNIGPFPVPAIRRLDRVVINRADGVAAIVAGTDGTLIPPAIPAGTLPVARVALTADTAALTAADVFDERGLFDQANQPLNANLTALSGLDAAAGLVEQTGAASFVKRPLGAASAASVPTIGDADARYAAINRTISAGTGLVGGGDLSADRALALADTAVTPGTYAFATVTVNQQGRITAAAGSNPGVAVQDDGAAVISGATALNFTGAGATA